MPQMVAAIEDSLRHVGQTAVGNTRIALLNKPKLPPPNTTPFESTALRSLQRNTSIVIIPVDKEQAMVGPGPIYI